MPPNINAVEGDDEGGMPFELAALEALLMTTCVEMNKQQVQLTQNVHRALGALRLSIMGNGVVPGSKLLEQVYAYDLFRLSCQ